MSNTADDLARKYFDRFVAAFGTFDPARISDLSATPGITPRADGSLVALTTSDDVIRYYQAATEDYHRNGCRSCRLEGNADRKPEHAGYGDLGPAPRR